MIIIVEGTDASGKTTLVKAITEEITARGREVHSMHHGRPPELTRRCVLNEYVNNVDKWYGHGTVIVSDRWHWGERTYAPIKRPESDKDGYGLLGVAGWRWVELYLLSRGASTFWLRQPLDVVTRRLSQRGDDYVQVDELSGILGLYELAATLAPSLRGVVSPDEGLENTRALAATIVSQAAEVHGESLPLRPYPEYIGCRRPSVLLVGDRRNVDERYPNETRIPFMPVNHNSGDYLLSSLPESHWRSVGIVNGWEIGERMHALWEKIGRPPLVALGNEAEKSILKHGSTTMAETMVKVPHPQHARRFNHADREEYGARVVSSALESNGEQND